MKRYIKSNDSIKIKTRFHGSKEFILNPTEETVSFSYWGNEHNNLPVYEAQDGSLWVNFKDGSSDSVWHKLKYISQGLWIPSNTDALELDDWKVWNKKQNSDSWWK